MIFDKNQTEFPTLKHKQIWDCGILILPEEAVLSDKVKALMDAEMFESCRQMRLFMLHSLSEMYKNAEDFHADPQKYLVFWFNVSSVVNQFGVLSGDRLIFYFNKWKNKIQRNRYISEMTDEYFEKIFSSTGIQIKIDKETAEITSSLYPKMFRAMNKMRDIVSISKEPGGANNSFFYCEFRKLCPEYKYDKADKKVNINEIEDKMSAWLDGDMKTTALDFVAYLKENKMSPKYSGVKNAWKVYYNKKCLLYIRLCDSDSSGEKKKWVINPHLLSIEKYEELIINEGLQNFLWDNVHNCMICRVPCIPMNRMILGKEIKSTCGGRQPFWFFDPDETTINCIKKLLEFERKARKD